MTRPSFRKTLIALALAGALSPVMAASYQYRVYLPGTIGQPTAPVTPSSPTPPETMYSYNWSLPSAWSACSTTCGTGVQMRDVSCLQSDGSSIVAVTDSFCDLGAMPPRTQSCTDNSTCAPAYTYNWGTPTNWSACSTTCGTGVQTRDVSCLQSDGSTSLVTADTSCDAGTKPAVSQSCSASSGCAPAAGTVQPLSTTGIYAMRPIYIDSQNRVWVMPHDDRTTATKDTSWRYLQPGVFNWNTGDATVATASRVDNTNIAYDLCTWTYSSTNNLVGTGGGDKLLMSWTCYNSNGSTLRVTHLFDIASSMVTALHEQGVSISNTGVAMVPDRSWLSSTGTAARWVGTTGKYKYDTTYYTEVLTMNVCSGAGACAQDGSGVYNRSTLNPNTTTWPLNKNTYGFGGGIGVDGTFYLIGPSGGYTTDTLSSPAGTWSLNISSPGNFPAVASSIPITGGGATATTIKTPLVIDPQSPSNGFYAVGAVVYKINLATGVSNPFATLDATPEGLWFGGSDNQLYASIAYNYSSGSPDYAGPQFNTPYDTFHRYKLYRIIAR